MVLCNLPPQGERNLISCHQQLWKALTIVWLQPEWVIESGTMPLMVSSKPLTPLSCLLLVPIGGNIVKKLFPLLPNNNMANHEQRSGAIVFIFWLHNRFLEINHWKLLTSCKDILVGYLVGGPSKSNKEAVLVSRLTDDPLWRQRNKPAIMTRTALRQRLHTW